MKIYSKISKVLKKRGKKSSGILGIDDIHPLRHIQLAQINEIFGEQLIEIPSEPQFIQRLYRVILLEAMFYTILNSSKKQRKSISG